MERNKNVRCMTAQHPYLMVHGSWLMVFAQKHEGSNGHAGSGEAGPSGAKLSAEDERLIAEDDEEIDMDELDEAELDDLEAKVEEQTRLKDEKGERG